MLRFGKAIVTPAHVCMSHWLTPLVWAVQISNADREMKHQRDCLEEFLVSKRIAPAMQQRVLAQIEHFWAQKSVFDETLLLDRLPPKHRKELLLAM